MSARKSYVIVPKDVTGDPRLTLHQLGVWVRLSEAMQDRWREMRLEDPAEACSILLTHRDLSSICEHSRIKSCRNYFETLGKLVGFTIAIEGRLTRIRWPNFAETQRLPIPISAQSRPDPGPIPAQVGPNLGPISALPRPSDPQTLKSLNTQNPRQTQKGRPPARPAVGKGAAAVEADLLLRFKAGNVRFDELEGRTRIKVKLDAQTRVQSIYTLQLQGYAEEIGFPWPDMEPGRDDKLITRMVACVISMHLDFDCLARAQRGCARKAKTFNATDERMQMQFVPSTVFGDKFAEYHALALGPDGGEPERDFNDMTNLEKQAMFARQGKLRGPLPERK